MKTKRLINLWMLLIYLAINNSTVNADPILPIGLDSLNSNNIDHSTQESISSQAKPQATTEKFADISGFSEVIIGSRIKHDPFEKRMSIVDARLHLDITKHTNNTTSTLITDFLYDPVLNKHHLNLSKGTGWLDLREANILLHPTTSADLKIGRQIITWGTGDLVCINDLFPKDWNSFFIGRHPSYLKAPSNSIKLSLYHDIANLDLAYNPLFNPDRYIDGKRISYFRSLSNSIAGRNKLVEVSKKTKWLQQDELAARVHRLFDSYETALYYYHGYWKSPAGVNAAQGLYTFPRLAVYGASIRGPAFNHRAIMYSEFGYYHSKDSKYGRKPGIHNNQLRWLIGYEQEIQTNLNLILQYYVKSIQQYTNYYSNLTNKKIAKQHHRHVVTINLLKKLRSETIYLSLFNYYLTNNKEGYLRPSITYKVTDAWYAGMGANLFYGNKKHTFFAQFRRNNNIYASIKYGFNN